MVEYLYLFLENYMQQILLSLSIALLAGLLLSRLAKLMKLPAVTAYLISGILIGPYGLGRLNIPGIGFASMAAVEELKLISVTALGFIAFAIGSEFRLSSLKKTGRQATIRPHSSPMVAKIISESAANTFFSRP